jgi:hypothetical protein
LFVFHVFYLDDFLVVGFWEFYFTWILESLRG